MWCANRDKGGMEKRSGGGHDEDRRGRVKRLEVVVAERSGAWNSGSHEKRGLLRGNDVEVGSVHPAVAGCLGGSTREVTLNVVRRQRKPLRGLRRLVGNSIGAGIAACGQAVERTATISPRTGGRCLVKFAKGG